MTSENLRYHAAGHLAAAALLAHLHAAAARVLLEEVARFAVHPAVCAPPQLHDKLAAAAAAPAAHVPDIVLMEAWFLDPLNTVIEHGGSRL